MVVLSRQLCDVTIDVVIDIDIAIDIIQSANQQPGSLTQYLGDPGSCIQDILSKKPGSSHTSQDNVSYKFGTNQNNFLLYGASNIICLIHIHVFYRVWLE